MDNYLKVIQNYAGFSGRAGRKEYWMFVLFNVIIMLAIAVVFGAIGAMIKVELSWVASLYSLAVMCPSIAVGIRRLHDQDKSGWWILTGLIPFVGGIVILVLMCLEGSPGDNRFGPSPKAITG
ncbi:MAG: DUF805 domain-containing protein [Candidatus Obscuribacterales bacterium]|jgi:uncharacterized membrane protein YhaH (DUF805 family)